MSMSRVPLGDVAEFINGVAFKPSDWSDSGRRIIRIQNLTNPSKPFNRTSRAVAKKYEVAPGDLLVSWSATLGVFSWEGPDTALVNQHIFRVEPDARRIEHDYLRHMLADALVDMERHLHGATMKHVNRAEFLATPIPLPPLAEQKRIAGILDAADALRQKRRESLAQLDTLLQSTFLEMFGDPVTNPMGWEVVDLASLVAQGDKINYGVVQPGDDCPGGMPLVRVGDFAEGTFVFENIKLIAPAIEEKYTRSRLNGRELLISCVGSIGTVCKVPSEAKGCNIARAVARVPLAAEISRDFMLHCLRSEGVQRHFLKETRTVSQPTLNIGLIKNAPVIQPPGDLQRRFAAIVESVEQQKASQRAHLEELENLFASLQHRAFAGDLSA
jgi:type I restriction enzyme, S subunit